MDTVLDDAQFAAACAAADTLKVLMIGNSFSICVRNNLPQIVASVPGKKLLLQSLYIGGCPLSRHWQNVLDGEKDPDFAPYQINTSLSGEGADIARAESKGNINDQLSVCQWDIISIQQASHESWDYGQYQPHAANLIAYLKEHAPQAEIVIQQTWSYRADDPRLSPSGEWGFDQSGMYERLCGAYAQLAAANGFRVIPTGLAVQLSRMRTADKFVKYDPQILSTLRWPDLPPQAGDVVGQCYWRKNSESGEMEIGRDSIHLNPRGEYLQACVWFSVLFGLPAASIGYISDQVGRNDAIFLQQCADDAVQKLSAMAN